MRLLGAVSLCAFASLWVQIEGLVGIHGILPFPRFLASRALEPLWRTPTLFWGWQEDLGLHAACALGCLLSTVLMWGVRYEGPVLMGLWALYLSLAVIGQDFLGFQWDILLLETLLGCLFVARWGRVRPVGLGIWVPRLILFKLILASGLVKLTSGDASWWDGTAMTFHYWTQPLPNPISYWMHGLPVWFHRLETWATLAIEILLPFCIFWRGGRRLAFWGFTLVLGVLFTTGNYGFFQWLTMVLVLSLREPAVREPPGSLRTWLALGWLVLTVPLGALHSYGRVFDYRDLHPWGMQAVRAVHPFRSVNAYGLFARMTTHRDEVWIEGQVDGVWQRYTLPYKPGPLDRMPPVLGLHMPRLDWQLWFAALRPCQRSPWLGALLHKLSVEEPTVLTLFEEAPEGVQAVRTRRAETTFGVDTWWHSAPPKAHCSVVR